MFWSGDKIKENLDKLISLENGNAPDITLIDCASYTLRVGPEYYVTSENSELASKKSIFTKENPSCVIPKGHFAFLMTEEIVSIPNNVIGLISFKAKFKFYGLINVSGFHVDPGYKGRLVFSLYNAGPSKITINTQEPMFLIWFADLDNKSTKTYTKDNKSFENMTISSHLLTNMSGDIYSPQQMYSEIEKLRDNIKNFKAKVMLWSGGMIFFVLSIMWTFRDKILKLLLP